MSKRIYAQHYGERKKAKLDVSISDHNFPLSQNNVNKESIDDNWGDDNDDEILLLASQACEEAYSSNDVSLLPDYSLCMQPESTSTQLSFQPMPSTSNSNFTFKKPSNNPPIAISTKLKEKCNTISSPLPGVSSKVMQKAIEPIAISEDFDFNDKICKSLDSEQIYKQLLQLQEENAKLKSENGKLLEKCVTKEGESSILRTQLKTCQIAVDNARLEKLRAQEKVQKEWSDKLMITNNQMTDLRNQLDFKNLEIISIKEKCKKLESTKVKLTQVTITGNDISQRHNFSSLQNDSLMTQHRRVKTTTNGVQTEDTEHLLKLNKTYRNEPYTLAPILPNILEPCTTQHYSLLDYNEKLQKTTDVSHNKCRIYSTFHPVPSTPGRKGNKAVSTKVLCNINDDVTSVVVASEKIEEKYFNIFSSVKSVLNETQNRLETVCHRVTTSFQKEMDEKYMELTSTYQNVDRTDLLKGSTLYKEEQEIPSRRMLATLSYVLESSKGVNWFVKHEQSDNSNETGQIIDKLNRICVLLDNASCATLYSGLLLSIISILQALLTSELNKSKMLEIIKTILISRPMLFVVTHILEVTTSVCLWENFRTTFCPGNSAGNLKTDYDQGVMLYKKDSCVIQVLLKQIEVCLKCIERQKLSDCAGKVTQDLISLYTNITEHGASLAREKTRCDCHLMLMQVIVYALRICAVMLNRYKNSLMGTTSKHKALLSVCRCGLHLLYQCSVQDMEFNSLLAHNEGHLIEFCELMKGFEHSDTYTNILSELMGTLQSAPEDEGGSSSFHIQPWIRSFESFSLVD